MARKSQRARRKEAAVSAAGAPVSNRPAAVAAVPGINVPLLSLSAVGMAIAAYLTYTGWTGAQAAFCVAGSGCDVVQSSRWGSFMGAPTAFWGLLTYAALAYIAARVGPPAVQWGWAMLVSTVGLAISVYLTAVSMFILDATCPYCLASFAVFAGIVGVLAWQRTSLGRGSWVRPLVPAAIVAALVMLAMHAQSSGTVVAGEGEDPYLAGLAAALTDSGARFYGASWCPHCQEQKALFGASAERLPYVECSPNRTGPTSQRCTSAGIRIYPTWIFGDGELVTGVLTTTELADRVDYKGPPAVEPKPDAVPATQ